MSFPRYPTYKPSGVEWLGEVPGHWEVTPLKWLCACLDGKRVPLNAEARSLRPGDVPYWGANTIQDYVDDHLFDEDLVLLGEDGAPFFDPFRPVAFFSQGRVWPNNHIHVLRPKATGSGRFLVHALNATDYSGFIDGSTRDKLTQSAMNQIPVAAPPPDEMRAIAAFLDRETARIDALVAEQERLIVLLREKRQAVISHAVTKGLDPSVPMKDSGVEWLGAVPAHWEVHRMKWVARMESGHTPDKKIAAYWDGGDIPWVSLNDTAQLKDNEYISETAASITQQGIDNSSAHVLPPGAVVFSRDATIGRCAITKRPMAVSQHFIAWICGPRILPAFLLLRLRSMTQELDRLTTGATVKTIGMPEVRTLTTTVPPLEEQHRIVTHCSATTSRLDALTTEAERAIVLLQERRAALISAAVTGQIDVRGLAPEVTA